MWCQTPVILLDVNVLVHAHRADAPGHARDRDWLESVVNSDIAYGLSDLVLRWI
jgi:predicted nucleic acid-binding protein